MFFKKELQSVSSQKELDRIKKMLDGAGIKYSVADKATDAVKRGGASDFRISVKRRDYKKALKLFKF